MEFGPLRDTLFERELCNLIRDLTFLSSKKYNKVSEMNVSFRGPAVDKLKLFPA